LYLEKKQHFRLALVLGYEEEEEEFRNFELIPGLNEINISARTPYKRRLASESIALVD
jgi:hypothetical protein